MERGKSTENLNLPDAINCSSLTNFTQIPNSLLRNPNVSAKAKTILSILLSNKEGWHSCMSSFLKMMKEGKDAIQSGVQELEEYHYLLRIKYRDKKSKIWKGSFWAYTDTPGKFEIQEHISFLDKKGLEIELLNKPEAGKPDMAYPYMAYPDMANPPLIILIDNNIKEKNISSSETNSLGYITPSLFELFWKDYPRKVSKGSALTSWNKLCRKGNDRPLWSDIRKAIHYQIKSNRWQYSKEQIPHPATWLNKSGWLNDPSVMDPYIEKEQKNPCPQNWRFGVDFDDGKTGCQDCLDNFEKTHRACESAFKASKKK